MRAAESEHLAAVMPDSNRAISSTG